MDILYTLAGTAGTIAFAAVAFIVFAIILDLISGKVPSLPLAILTPWLTGATFVGFLFLNMWSGWQWFSDLGWASIGLTALALVLKWLTVRRNRRFPADDTPEPAEDAAQG